MAVFSFKNQYCFYISMVYLYHHKIVVHRTRHVSNTLQYIINILHYARLCILWCYMILVFFFSSSSRSAVSLYNTLELGESARNCVLSTTKKHNCFHLIGLNHRDHNFYTTVTSFFIKKKNVTCLVTLT